MICLFLWLFFWEIGGQNVPNDWSDLKEDSNLQAETVPMRFGTDGMLQIILCSLALAIALSLLLYWVTPADLSPIYLVGALLCGVSLLLVPAYELYKGRSARQASALFNRASYYPLAMLAVVCAGAFF